MDTRMSDNPATTEVARFEIDRLNIRASELERTSPEEMLRTAQQAHALAADAGYEKGVVWSLGLISKAHLRLGDLNQAFDIIARVHSVESLELPLQAELYNIRGIVSLYLRHFDRAFVYYQQALELARRADNKELEGRMLNNIGEIYRLNGDYATALDYYRRCIALLEPLPGHGSVSVPVANLAACYLAMGELDLAKRYALESLQQARAEQDQMIESGALQYLGTIARKEGRLDDALVLLRQSLEIYRRTRETIHTAEALVELHQVHFASGNCTASITKLDEALLMAEEAGDLSLQAQVFLELAGTWRALGDLARSLDYYQRRTGILETIEQSEREKMLRAIEVQIEADRSMREKELYQALSQQLEEKAQQLSEAYSSLTAVSDMGRTITATQDLAAIFAHAHAKLQELMPADAFGVGLYSEDENAIVYRYLVEDRKPLGAYSISMSSTDSLAATCFRQGQGFVINSPREDVSHMVENISTEKGSRMSAMMFHPLQVEGEIIGVISVQSRREHAYSDRALEILGLLASYLAIAIRNAERSHELQSLNRRLGELSHRDGLTGIANRRRFDQFLLDTWHSGIRQEYPVSLILIDTDCFKQYNDYYGHLQGDETIRTIARTIESCIYRRTDLVARYGGDEFVVVLGDTNAEGALITAQKIHSAMHTLAIEHKASPISSQVTLSIGVATITPGRGSSPDELIAVCDKALYAAKDAGRDRICVAD